jgi:uncharacterized protein (TIGR03790 family)
LLCLGLLLPACAEDRQPPVSPTHVLVVKNTSSPDSEAIADYYALKRHLPHANVCSITCPTTETCAMKVFKEQIQAPIQQFIRAHKLDIDFIVLTKDIPIRTFEGQYGGFCTDSVLATMDWTLLTQRTPNPYFNKHDRFSHRRYNLYLVTRLIGYTRADCLKLVDNALAARPARGLFILHTGVQHDQGTYKMFNDAQRQADALLRTRGFNSLIISDHFTGHYQDLMGYISWGSNDALFKKDAYHSLTFVPGALADTAVSSSGRTFNDPHAPGQSLIADLIAQGVTGCKGYVSEPFLDSISDAGILFDRYTSGFTLAESFYMASRFVYWKDIVIGDPLCAPYAASQ